jgi:single-stranded-DNA-specific exonuclease
MTLADDQENLFRAIWWGSGVWPLPEWMESGIFALAYTARPSNYRGQPDVQIEWLDAQPAEGQVIEVGTRPAIKVQDYRHEAHPLPVLQRLLAEVETQVWAEGEARQKLAQAGITASDRTALQPALALVIWTIPPGWAELQAGLAAVSPQTVYLFAVEPESDDLENFLKRLAGMVKYALKANQGHLQLTALAAATAQTEGTVRVGLAWLQNRGYIAILSQSGEEWLLGKGQGQEQPDAEQRLTQVKEALAETTAFRLYYRRADAAGLASLTS